MQPAIVYDLEDPSGVAQIWTHAILAREMIENDPKRYTRELPPGTKLGPKSGLNRIVLV
jgi:hypothetical protein